MIFTCSCVKVLKIKGVVVENGRISFSGVGSCSVSSVNLDAGVEFIISDASSWAPTGS